MCTNCLSFSVTTISHCSCVAFLILKQVDVNISSSSTQGTLRLLLLAKENEAKLKSNLAKENDAILKSNQEDQDDVMFQPSDTFQGAQLNMVFRSGTQGVGYYTDKRKKINNIEIENVVDAVVDAAVTSSSFSSSQSSATSTSSLDKTTTDNEVTKRNEHGDDLVKQLEQVCSQLKIEM